MALFTNCKTLTPTKSNNDSHLYSYRRENKDYVIPGGMLNSLFKTHGYCVDPGARTPVSLTPESIQSLRELALQYDDSVLLGTINLISKAKAPSPRMVNDTLMHETTINEKRRFDHLATINQSQTLMLLKTLLNIGMYLAGWKGIDEPYITAPRTVYDTVRVELKVFPLIQSLYTNPNYILIKNFPIIGYFQATSGTAIKPSIVDTKLNVDHCLNQISLGEMNSTSLKEFASYLISTSYYYITTVCNNPLPMVEPLIHNLVL